MKTSHVLGLGLLGLSSFFAAFSASAAAELPLQYRFSSTVLRHATNYGDVTDETYHVVYQDLRNSTEAEGSYVRAPKNTARVVLRRDNNEAHPTNIDYAQALRYQRALDLSEEFTGATDRHETRNSIARVISDREYYTWQRELWRSGVYHRNVSYHENGLFRVRTRQAAAQERAAKIRSTYHQNS